MRLAIAAVAALGLAACGPSEPASGASSTATSTTESAAPAASAPAPAIEGPAAGKWRTTVTAMGQAMPPTEVCYTKQVSFEEAEKMQQQAGMSCSEQSYRKEGDAWLGHSVCTMQAAGAPMKVTTDSRITGDFSSKYTIELASRMDPAPMPSMAEQTMTITAERVGDC